MRLLFLLLFCAQSLVSIFASSPHSDIWSRGAKMSRYIVTPVDPTNITATESKLKTMFGEEKFLKSRRQDEITFSFFTNLSKNVTAAVARELDSKRPVESQDIAPRADAVSTHVDRYTAMPKENADDEKMGEFLKSKIQLGTLMVAVEDQDGRVMAWYNVALSQEAKEEVEKYEGIEMLIPLPSMASDSASASNDRSQSEAKRSEVLAQGVQLYNAMATNDSDVKSTEEFLKSKVQQGVEILQHKWDGVVSGWFNLALDDNAKKEVEGHEGIKRVNIMGEFESFEALPENDNARQQSEAKRSEMETQDTQLYRAMAKDGTNVKATEEFLRTKVKTPDRIYQLGWNGKITGWYHLELDPEAKKAVEAYEGIDHVSVMRKMDWFGELPENDKYRPQPEPRRSDVFTQDTELYGALAADNTDVAKTEEFLSSKVQNPDHILHYSWGGVVHGWYNLKLDSVTAKEVEAYEGIKAMRVPKTLADFTASANNMVPSKHRSTENLSDPEFQHKALIRRDDFDVYQAIADNTTDPQITEDFLKSKVQQGRSVQRLTRHWKDNSIIGWSALYLDPAALKEVQAHDGIKSIKLEGKLVDFRALSIRDTSQYRAHVTHMQIKEDVSLSRRASEWTKQNKADKALVMNSQYQGADLNSLTDFVHVSEPGKGSFVYVMGSGVRLEAVNQKADYEFHLPGGSPENIEVLQTQMSIEAKQDPHTDADTEFGHTTAVASKALGSQWGVAKSATLIPVKRMMFENEVGNAFDLILANIQAHPERAHQSVVLIASGSEEAYSYAIVKASETIRSIYEGGIQQILGLGIPIVCAAGNNAEKPGRQNIDTLPSVFQDENTPLINVGAADYEGNRIPMSQHGSQLTVYAPGYLVESQSPVDLSPIVSTGTSNPAPQVAGLIATYLSYASKPWDDSKQGIERVKAIRDYITSDRSSWERKLGIRMIWNGAGENEHRSAGANGIGDPPKQPTPSAPPTPPSPPPAQPSKALAVILQRELISDYQYVTSPIYKNRWLFYETDRGVAPGCKDEKDALANAEVGRDAKMIFNAPWPSITQPVKVDNMECEYKNNGQNPGALWCKGRKDAITCYEDQAKKDKDPTYCRNGPGEIARRPTAYCEW